MKASVPAVSRGILAVDRGIASNPSKSLRRVFDKQRELLHSSWRVRGGGGNGVELVGELRRRVYIGW
jgi:hypothetical protein